MNNYENTYEMLRRLIDNGIGSGDVKDRRIGGIDGCGHLGIVSAASADALLMHAADIIISNFDSCGECWGCSLYEIDVLVEQASEHVAAPGLDRLSSESWNLIRRVVRQMAIWFAVTHEPTRESSDPEAEEREAA